jgi:cytochrome c oxidase subunit 4
MSEATPAPSHRMPPEQAHGHSVPTPHHHVNYFAVFGTLVVLTIVTVAVAFINIKSELAKVLLALTIASIKASAVILYFMHMKFEGKMIYLILIVPLCFCVLLVIALLPDVTFGPIYNSSLWEIWRHPKH